MSDEKSNHSWGRLGPEQAINDGRAMRGSDGGYYKIVKEDRGVYNSIGDTSSSS